MVWAFPLVGLAVGLVAAGFAIAATVLGLPEAIAAGLVLAVQIVLTGAMHEDGLADTADGFWGGLNRDRRLEIMKDSAIGSYGVLALILSLGLRWTSLAALLPLGPGPVVAAAILSRAVMPFLMLTLPHARRKGLSHRVGAPTSGRVATGVLLAIALGWLTTGPAIIGAALAAGAAAAIVALLAQKKIGGQTGDVLGAAQQLGELAALLALLCILTP